LVHHQNFFADTIGHNHFLIVILGSHPTNSFNLPSGAADLDGNHSFGNHAFAHGVNPLPFSGLRIVKPPLISRTLASHTLWKRVWMGLPSLRMVGTKISHNSCFIGCS